MLTSVCFSRTYYGSEKFKTLELKTLFMLVNRLLHYTSMVLDVKKMGKAQPENTSEKC